MQPKAKGRFTRRAGVTNHVMVATVTGIAPYMSMIRQSSTIESSLSCAGAEPLLRDAGGQSP